MDTTDPTIAAASSELGRLQAQVSTARVRKVDLERELELMAKNREQADVDWAMRIADHRERADEARIALEQGTAELDALNMELVEVSAQLQRDQERIAARKADLEQLDAKIEAQIARSQSETDAETRLAGLTEAIDAHQTVLDGHLQGVAAAKARQTELAGEITAAEASMARRKTELESWTDDLAATKLQLADEQDRVRALEEEAKTRQEALDVVAAIQATAKADLEVAFNGINTQRQALEQEATRQAQAQQLLDRLTEEVAKTRQAAVEALAEAETARSEVQAAGEAVAASQREIGARLEAIAEADRLNATKAAELTAREAGLRAVSLKMATAQAQLKQAIVKQGLTAAGISVPDVEG